MKKTPWRFYGRQKELRRLATFVDNHPRFDVLAIRGRRQVGKSDLVQTFLDRQTDRLGILCQLEDTDTTHDAFFDRLAAAAEETDPRLLKEFTVGKYEYNNRFSNLTEHLLQQGCVVVLDEFQNIGNTGNRNMQSQFQHLIDRLRRRNRDPTSPHCRLILLGSEQQRFWEMLNHVRVPLYQRVRKSLHVQPWIFPEFKEMALDQGWDRNPHRLLTLWTTYNGLPGHWERFGEEDAALGDFSRIPDDAEWTRQFLAREEAHRQTRDGAFHRQMEIELRESDRAIVRWLAEKPEGRNLATDLDAPAHREAVHAIKTALQNEVPSTAVSDPEDMHTRVHDAIENRLSGAHLGLLRGRAPIDSEDTIKWSVVDNFARFQLQVLEPFAQGSHPDESAHQVLATERVSALQHLKGYGLEQFAAQALHHFFAIGADVLPADAAGRTGLYTRFERTDVSGDLDIVLIHHKEHPTSPKNYDGVRDFWIGSAKRSTGAFCSIKTRPEDSSMTALRKDITRIPSFLAPLSVGSTLTQTHFSKEWRGCVNYVVIARSFTDAEKALVSQAIADTFAAYPVHGIDQVYSLDIADIMSGRGPQPLPLPEPAAEPTLKETPEEDDGANETAVGT
ncbi:MAG: AAA family ATPase [Aestuariivita sp.]|nr:AAA family ATPase [Aestuariivita sp.]MCY4203222.1 AAA family ATPase [Aestuariivita sp.]